MGTRTAPLPLLFPLSLPLTLPSLWPRVYPGNHTAVTWSLTGENDFMAKAVGLFMNMDRMVGGEFEKGLAHMKSVVEAAPKQ